MRQRKGVQLQVQRGATIGPLDLEILKGQKMETEVPLWSGKHEKCQAVKNQGPEESTV